MNSAVVSGLHARAGPVPESVIVFDVLTVIAFIILILSVTVARLSGIQRVKTWYLLQLSSAFCCLSFLFLVGHQTGPEPPLQFCAFSAALIYAAPPMVAAAALCFVIELYLRLSSALYSKKISDILVDRITWSIPMIHGIVFWISLWVGLSDDAQKIKRDPTGVYCHVITSKIPTLTTGSIVFVSILAMLIMEGYMTFQLIRQRAALRAMNLKNSDFKFPLHLFIRVSLYTIAGAFAMVTVVIMNLTTTVEVTLLTIIPLSVAIVFGTQKELWSALLPCVHRLKRRKGTSADLEKISDRSLV